MNIVENVLQSLQEECAEIIVAASKANRFGLADRYPEHTCPSTQEKLVGEIHDFMGVLELLQEHGIVPKEFDRSKIEAKKEKVARYQRYSRATKTLQ